MHRVEGERGKALEIVAALIEDKPSEEPIPTRERIALVADLVWMLRLEGREDDALAEIHRWLVVGQPGSGETYREEYLPLLLERARLHLAAQRRAEAARDLQEFFQRVPAESISHAEYAEGRLMEGMIEEDAGNLRQAREAWLKGARRYWHEGYLSPRDIAQARGVESIHVGNSLSCDTIIAAWTGEVTSDEAVQMMNSYLAGSGTADGILVRLLRNSLSPEFLRSLALTSGASPRIRQYQRRGLLRQQSLREDCIHGMVAVLYVAVNQSAFDGRPYPEALEELMCQQATNLVETFERGELPPADLRMVLELWRGHHNERGWEKLRGQLDPKLSATMALIYGRTSARLGKPEQARPFFEYVKQHEPTGSPLYGDAEEQLKSLDKPAG
jgi:tetratricopeptide (TPR) repeat protein